MYVLVQKLMVVLCNNKMFSGAVYQAAAMSKAFVVKKFLIKEATIFPIEVNSTYVCTYIHTYRGYSIRELSTHEAV